MEKQFHLINLQYRDQDNNIYYKLYDGTVGNPMRCDDHPRTQLKWSDSVNMIICPLCGPNINMGLPKSKR